MTAATATAIRPESFPAPYDLDRFCTDALDRLRAEGRYRVFAQLERAAGAPVMQAYDRRISREITVWCSNDYLGLSRHPEVTRAYGEAAARHGVGGGGTRNIAGTTVDHVELEAALARLHEQEAALLFSSGYTANDSALSTLAGRIPGCLVFSDALNHASMIEGIRRSGAAKQVFRHNDVEHLDALLSAADPEAPKLVVFEACYSMDGDFSPVRRICDVAERHGAMTYLDEVHAVGVYGPAGSGVAGRDGQARRLTVIQGTLNKAVGVAGGYIAGSASVIDFVRSSAPGFIFSTALPAAAAAAGRAALAILAGEEGDRLRLRLRAVTALVRDALEHSRLPLLPSPSHILPLMVGDAETCRRVADDLARDHGVYVQPINYPTVPRGTERLRITPTPAHGDADVLRLADALDQVWTAHGLPRAPWRPATTASRSLHAPKPPVQHLQTGDQ